MTLCASVHSDFRASFGFYRDGFYDIAKRSFADFLKKYPDSTYREKALYYLALSQMKLSDNKAALEPLAELLKIKNFEYRNDVIYYLCLNYHEAGFYKESLEMSQLLAGAEISAEWYEDILFTSVKNNIFLNNIVKAAELSNSYMNAKYKKYEIDVMKFLADYYISNRDYEKTVIHIGIMITLTGLSPTERNILMFNYLYALFMLGRDNQAVVFFERNNIEFSPELYSLMADSYYRLGNKEKALSILDILFDRAKDKSAAFKHSVIMSEMNNFAGALNILEKRTSPNDFVYEKAGYAKQIPDYKRGLEILKRKNIREYDRNEILLFADFTGFLSDIPSYKLLSDNMGVFEKLLNTERNTALYNTAVIMFQNGENERSQRLMERWLREFTNDPLYDRVLYMNGVVLKNLKRYNDSIAEFAKVQRLKKRDRVYFESYVERGECFFILREYGQAIRSYETYLSNNVTDLRKAEVMLQLGNSHYNIKRYNNALKVYYDYVNKYGNQNNIYVKIADTLLKSGNYKEAQKYFGNNKSAGDYPFFVYLYSSYQNEDFNAVFSGIENIASFNNSKYFPEMLYLIILSGQRLKKDNELVNIYLRNENFIRTAEEDKIRRVLTTSFLRIRRADLTEKLFINPDNKTLFFLGESYADYLFPDHAGKIFTRLVNQKISLEYREYFKILRFHLHYNNFEAAEKTADLMGSLFTNAGDVSVYKAVIYLKSGKKDKLDGLLSERNISDDRVFQRFIRYSADYINDVNKSRYLNNLSSLLDSADIDKLLIRQIIKLILELSIETGDYAKAAVMINKIPSVRMNILEADIRLLEAELYEKSGNLEKAIDLYLRIFYIYPSDVLSVHQSITRVVELYRRNNENQRIKRITDMFEEKYFKL